MTFSMIESLGSDPTFVIMWKPAEQVNWLVSIWLQEVSIFFPEILQKEMENNRTQISFL